MKTKANFIEQDPRDLKLTFKKMGIEPFHLDQVMDWVYRKGITQFDKMSNLSHRLRRELKSKYEVDLGEIVTQSKSKDDGSIKLLLRMGNKDLVETVYIPRGKRRTVCVSSQVGCKLRCAFCASGQAGFGRDLSSGEIIAQILHARKLSDTGKITHIVFMGMGEPFDNFNSVMKSIRILNNPKLLSIGARKITVSTSGIIPKIEQFSNKGLQIELSVSLHGATDKVRSQIMPINRKWPVKDLIQSCREYVSKTNRVVTFEYLLAKDLNSSIKDARDLVKLLKNLPCKVNLIPLNPIKEFPYKRPTYKEIRQFQNILNTSRIKSTVRFSRGNDINAACGQLRRVVNKGIGVQ